MTHPATVCFAETDALDDRGYHSMAVLTAHQMMGTVQRKRCRGVVETRLAERDFEGMADRTVFTKGTRMGIRMTRDTTGILQQIGSFRALSNSIGR